MKDVIGAILGCLVIVGLLGCAIFFGGRMMGIGMEPHELGKAQTPADCKTEWITVNIVSASKPVCEIKHSMSYVIPTGKEYYFFAITDDYKLLTIRAEKDWFEKNFNEEDYSSKNPDGLKVKAYVRELNGDAEIICKKEAKSVSTAFNPTVYLDIHADRYGLYLLLIGVIPIILCIVGVILHKAGVLNTQLDSSVGKAFMIVLIVSFFAYAALMLHTFAMI